MRVKRIVSTVMACAMLLACIQTPVLAQEIPDMSEPSSTSLVSDDTTAARTDGETSELEGETAPSETVPSSNDPQLPTETDETNGSGTDGSDSPASTAGTGTPGPAAGSESSQTQNTTLDEPQTGDMTPQIPGSDTDSTPEQSGAREPTAAIAQLSLDTRSAGPYYVDSKDAWDEAMQTIENSDETDATVILTADVGIFNNQYKYTIGAQGKHITVRSEGDGAPYSIGSKSMNSVQLTGDVTFDNVWLSLGQGSDRSRGTISSFYANGYTAEFTENFAQPIANLYGGSNGTKITANTGSNNGGTHLIINGDIIGEGNSQNYKVFGGGLYSSSSTGSVAGSVTIELGPHCRVPWVYGGGENSSVGGNVTITLTGNVADPDHVVGNITGGGRATSKGPSNGKDSGTVAGDINLNLYSGRFAAISSGGGTNETDTSSSTIQSSNKTSYGTPYRYYATVGGNVNIVLGQPGAEDGTLLITTVSDSLAGSLYSVIQGSINVTIQDGTQFGKDSGDHDFHGMGYNDIVEGSVNITMEGGKIYGDLYGLGVTVGNSDGCHKIGWTGDPKEDSYYYPKDALTITLRGGEVDNIAWFYNFQNSLKTTHAPYIYGNVIVNIQGGSVGCVYFGNPESASPVAVTGYQLPYVYGTKGMELHITGGTFTNVNQSVCAHSISLVYNGQRIYFENKEPVSLYRIYNAKSNNNGEQADIIVNNTAPVQLKNYRYTSSSYLGNYRGALYECGDLDIQKGTLILPGQNKILGDFHIGEDATLVTNGKMADINENGFLNVGGKASGSGKLLVAQSTTLSNGKGWLNCESMTPQLPDVGEVYLRSNTTTETSASGSDATLLNLANAPSQGRYVEYTTDATAISSYSHAWRIAQGDAYGVLYGFQSGTKGHGLTDEITAMLPNDDSKYEMGSTVTAIQPQKTIVEDTSGKGIFVFEGYKEENSQVVSENNLKPGDDSSDTKKYIRFNGVWKWYAKHTVTYEYEGTVPDGAPAVPAMVTSWQSATVTLEDTPTFSGYTFSGWTVKSPVGLTIENGTFTMPNEDVVLVGSWEKVESVQIAPADIKIYMGGDSYEGTSDKDGTLISSKGLPTPGFTVTLPESLKTVSVTDLTLQYQKDTQTLLQWKFEKYGNGATSVYRIVPAEGTTQTHVRMVFTNSNGDVIDDDRFDVSKNLNQTLTMELYGEGIDAGSVTIVDKRNNKYPVTTSDSEVTVYGTTATVELANIGTIDSGYAPESGKAGAATPDGTVYTINDSNVQTAADAEISLLFDDIINTNDVTGVTNTDLLIQKADETLEKIGSPLSDSKCQYEFKYLDIVDESNGNTWITAKDSSGQGQTVTVYWPLPEGTNANTKFVLLHYTGLNRSMGADVIADEIQTDIVTSLDYSIQGDHIVFTTESFSPYALVWGDDSISPVSTPNAGTQNTAPPTSTPVPGIVPTATPIPAPERVIPQTGDDSQPLVWVALVLISGAVLAGLAVYRKKHSDK